MSSTADTMTPPERPRSAKRSSVRSAVLAQLEDWYGGGDRIAYDPQTHVVDSGATPYRVFLRREGDLTHAVSFLPGFPDGSSGWANVLPDLPGAETMPKLFVEYLGMGDSDTATGGYRYSTAERTDLVEALWRHLGIRSTTLVAFDFSSLVVLEHLRRRLERAARGEAEGGPDIRGVFIFNGGLFTDGHTHPWWTTPLLSQTGGGSGLFMGGVPFPLFMVVAGVMWSRDFAGRAAGGHRVLESLKRRNGQSYLARAAGFVADHKGQGERLDFGALFRAYQDRFPFLVGGSTGDAFEHRQVDLAEARLAPLGCKIVRLSGGHMTTDEQPRALAKLITEFAQGTALAPRG